MKIGTKSVLFGAHQFLIHPWFVAAAWWKLYGFPFDPRLWVAFFVHDLGYLGKPNMDGEEGERHIELGARIMALFDRQYTLSWSYWKLEPSPHSRGWIQWAERFGSRTIWSYGRKPTAAQRRWSDLCLYHSRFWAKKHYVIPSRLCFADKLAIAMEPWWFYLPRAKATGEVREYRSPERMASKNWQQPLGSDKEWFLACQNWCRKWVAEHKDGKADSWTPAQRIT